MASYCLTFIQKMESIIIGSLLLSLLHAVIPNHWLPVLAIGRKEGWTLNEVTKVTLISALGVYTRSSSMHFNSNGTNFYLSPSYT
jgi:hypothetical protein